MSERPLVIGVCGGIGSGKSVVRKVLGLLLDCPTYDCDTRAKALYRDPVVRAEITSLLHEDPIDQDGRLKKELLSCALHDDHLRPLLEGIIHEAVREDFAHWLAESAEPYAILESGILFSSGMDRCVDCSIEVAADEALRSRRTQLRDRSHGATQYRSMSSLQLKEADLRERLADYTIYNNEFDSLIHQCERILTEINHR